MKAVVRKEKILLRTYPYSDPSPIPAFGRMYPYNRMDGYTADGVDQWWEMVILENRFVKIWINPAVGGKVWGAVEKSTGKEFIYFNHAVKFRDVAMRGPWTSGGIEFNVGILGHSLSCASPVDHFTRTHADGGVSCFIGATDWPSRTRWFVEISLTDDAAWFKTRTSWYNSSGVDQSYYSWSNAGIKTSGDLEYIFPGNAYLGHDGRAHPWPLDAKGRNLSMYKNNDFGHYKSYHVFGAAADSWGCYWHEDDFGMAHYSLYDQQPGKKIWIWGLSRYGMIWEDLLTDKDGQYTEVQSGRLFNQSISSSSATPFKHRSFLPGAFDAWDEYWMPVKGTGGLHFSSPALSFYIDGGGIHLCANQPLEQVLKVEDRNGVIATVALEMKAMENLVVPLSVKPDEDSCRLWLDDVLIYDAGEQRHRLKRPAEIASGYQYDSVESLCLQGKEWERQRFFARAIDKYKACLARDPFYIRALVGMAALKLRSMEYDACLSFLIKALSVDSYDGEANYLYGLVNVRLDNSYDAKDGFSIASQSVAYRSAAMTELGKMMIRRKQYSKALSYLEEALGCNGGNCQAYQLQVFVYGKTGRKEVSRQLAELGLQNDPLDHVLRWELYRTEEGISAETFTDGISSEWPHETFLELASFYTNIEAWDEAEAILCLSPAHAMVELWKGWIYYRSGRGELAHQSVEKLGSMPTEGVFPHRHEDMAVLQWVISRTDRWQMKYFLALGLTQAMREEDALQLLESCGDEPEYYPFYLVRGKLKNDPEGDLLRAVALAPDAWRTSMQLSAYYAGEERWEAALRAAREGSVHHPGNYYLGLQLAKCYMYNEQFEAGIALMKGLRVLPNEGASEGRNVWRETNLYAAIAALAEGRYDQAAGYVLAARTWPENIGVGKPYDVDERLEDYLDWHCTMKRDVAAADVFMKSILSFRGRYPEWAVSSNDLLALLFSPGGEVGGLGGKIEGRDGEVKGPVRKIEGAGGKVGGSGRKVEGPGSDSLPVRWCNAFLDGDLAKLEMLSREKVAPPVVLPYEIPFEDREFALIKTLYKTGLLTIKN